jgi:hypothetical protein
VDRDQPIRVGRDLCICFDDREFSLKTKNERSKLLYTEKSRVGGGIFQ